MDGLVGDVSTTSNSTNRAADSRNNHPSPKGTQTARREPMDAPGFGGKPASVLSPA